MSNTELDIIDDVAQAIIVPPDGGWGWVIVFASFFCNLIVDGIIFTAGQSFQPAWSKAYGVSSATSAWAVSLLSGFYLLSGPIVSALANIFGCRKVVLAGTVLAAAGFGLSMIAPSITFLYFTFGIMGGIGFGFIFMPAVVIVSYYFEKKRATATGIALCGSGIGTFVFAPFINHLMDEYVKWENALLILTGLTLNCLIFGALFRPLEAKQDQLKKVEDKFVEELANVVEENDHNLSPIGSDEAVNELRAALKKADVSNGTPKLRQRQNTERLREDSISSSNLSPLMDPRTTRSPFTSQSRLRTTSERPPTQVRSFVDIRGRERLYSLFSIPEDANRKVMRSISRESVQRINRPLSRPDIFITGSLAHLPQYNSAPDTAHYIASTLNLDAIAQEDQGGFTVKDTILATLHSMLDVKLLKSPSFLMLAFSGFFTLAGFFVPFIYLPKYARDECEHSHELATLLVSILGITNIVARVVCGWLSDQPRVNALLINNIALCLGGLATMIVPHLQAYWLLCLYCVVFGLGTACFASLRSVICVELLGLERLTNAFGLLMLFMGLASLIGSPIAAWLYDLTGNFKLSFYVTGGMVLISGLIGFPLRRVSDWENRRLGLIPPTTTVDPPSIDAGDVEMVVIKEESEGESDLGDDERDITEKTPSIRS